MKHTSILSIVTILLTALLLLATLGRPLLLRAAVLDPTVLGVVGLACLLAGFLAGVYFILSDRPGGAGEAQTPNLDTELTPVEKRSLALWWDDEPAILQLPKPMPHGHAPVGDGPLAAIEYKALSRAREMGCTISDGGWIHLPEHLRQPGEESMFVDLLDFSDYLNRTQVTS